MWRMTAPAATAGMRCSASTASCSAHSWLEWSKLALDQRFARARKVGELRGVARAAAQELALQAREALARGRGEVRGERRVELGSTSRAASRAGRSARTSAA